MSRLFEKQRGDLLGLLWFSTALIVGLSLASYSPLDPSLNSLSAQTHPQNLCGYLGSFLADIFYQCFGLTSWFLVFGSLRLCVSYFAGKKLGPAGRRWIVDIFILLTLSCLFALHLSEGRFFSGHIRAGGWVGYVLVRQLVSALNPVGLDIFLFASLAVLSLLWSQKSIGELFDYPREILASIWHDVRRSFARFGSALKSLWKTRPKSPPIVRAEPTPAAKFFPLVKEEKKLPNFESETDEMTDEDKTPISGFLLDSETGRAPKKIMPKISRKVANWELPKLSLLENPPSSGRRLDEREIKGKAKLLVEKLAQFSVRGEVVGIKPGPAVTMFEFKPAADVKISKITELADDLSLALSSESVRIIAPIPGRDVVGIETSNSQRDSVYLKDILTDEDFWSDDCKLPLTLGRKADGEPRVVDLRKMPHLLVAGTTGSGKSVFVVSMLTGLLFRHSPKTLKLILVDPKQVDLAAFSTLPHLIMPPIREPKKAVSALRWAIREMEKRYRSMSKFGARGIEPFNDMVSNLSPKATEEHTTFNQGLDNAYHPESYYYQSLPLHRDCGGRVRRFDGG